MLYWHWSGLFQKEPTYHQYSNTIRVWWRSDSKWKLYCVHKLYYSNFHNSKGHNPVMNRLPWISNYCKSLIEIQLKNKDCRDKKLCNTHDCIDWNIHVCNYSSTNNLQLSPTAWRVICHLNSTSIKLSFMVFNLKCVQYIMPLQIRWNYTCHPCLDQVVTTCLVDQVSMKVTTRKRNKKQVIFSNWLKLHDCLHWLSSHFAKF